jgi:uncharacterized membrane protein YphA (DoxX/SURF4 family)
VSTIASIASLLVGAAFVVAGGSKLAAGELWPSQARELGAPSVTISVVPWAELCVGAALVAGLVRPVAAVAALVMLVAFTALIGLRLAEGKRPACACFGAWSATPIGPMHLVRNGVLIVLAVVALAR